MSFNYKSEVGDEERKKLLEEVEGRRVLSIILKCLLKAGDFYRSAKFKDYRLGSVDISLGLTPGVNINFTKRELKIILRSILNYITQIQLNNLTKMKVGRPT